MKLAQTYRVFFVTGTPPKKYGKPRVGESMEFILGNSSVKLRSPTSIPDNLVLHHMAAVDSNCDDMYLVWSHSGSKIPGSFI